MHIAVDITFLQDQYASRGIGRYGKEIVSRLVQQVHSQGIEHRLTLLGFGDLASNLSILAEYYPLATADIVKNPRISFKALGDAHASQPRFNLQLYKQQIMPFIIQSQPDLYFAVHFERGLPSELITTAVVVHDVIPLATGHYSQQNFVINFLKGAFYKRMWHKVQQADLVFTSSNFSKAELLKVGRLLDTQVQVVYLGIAPQFWVNTKPVLNQKWSLTTNGYLIYDAGLEANKQATKLIETLAALHRLGYPLPLVITGADFVNQQPTNERSRKLWQYATALGIAHALKPVGRVSEVELVELLANARAYINLSQYEGFGFGPLQAMAAGVPAIISNNQCFAEVSGAAALIVDPQDPRSAAQTIAELLSNPAQITSLINQGKVHAKQFTWERTFMQTWGQLLAISAQSIIHRDPETSSG